MGYATAGAAKHALRKVQWKGGRHKERRVYLCERCRRFHLTKELHQGIPVRAPYRRERLVLE
jgi:hypothetical protein